MSTQYTLKKGDDKGRSFYVARFNTVKPLNLAGSNVRLYRKGRENLPPEEKKQPYAHLPERKKEQFVRQGKVRQTVLPSMIMIIDVKSERQMRIKGEISA